MTTFRKLIWKYVPHSIISVYKLFFHKKSFLREKSYLRTIVLNKPMDKDKSPLPWLSYSAIAFLEDKLTKDMTVFEYGSGMSTLFFRERVKSIKSVENHKGWFDTIKESLSGSNSEVIFVSLDKKGEYAASIKKTDAKYDVILVDGRDRVNCCKNSLERLSDSGIFIFDDADREEYQEVFEIMEQAGFRYIRFYGLRPASCYFDTTAIFYKPNVNIFSI